LALQALGAAHDIAGLGGELGECMPRRRAVRIDTHRCFVVSWRVLRAQRTHLGLRGADQTTGNRGAVLADIGMIGERAEMERGLAPQLAREAALAERERDPEVAAIEVMR